MCQVHAIESILKFLWNVDDDVDKSVGMTTTYKLHYMAWKYYADTIRYNKMKTKLQNI